MVCDDGKCASSSKTKNIVAPLSLSVIAEERKTNLQLHSVFYVRIDEYCEVNKFQRNNMVSVMVMVDEYGELISIRNFLSDETNSRKSRRIRNQKFEQAKLLLSIIKENYKTNVTGPQHGRSPRKLRNVICRRVGKIGRALLQEAHRVRRALKIKKVPKPATKGILSMIDIFY